MVGGLEMSAKEEFEKIEERIERFAKIELPETIEAAALEKISEKLKGTPLEPLASMIARDGEIFDPDRTGLVKVETAISAIEAARELFVSIFSTDQIDVAATLNPIQAAVSTLGAVVNTIEALWKSAQKTSFKDTAEAAWQFVLHFAGSMAAILYGPKAVKFSLGLSEVVFALRENRLFQSKAKRAVLRKRSRD